MSPFSPSSSESSHSHQSEKTLPVSFSETVLDSVSSDRARASIPEQYQSTFDELRNGILAFCAEFQIPVSALSNKEIFGTYLASPKIPQRRMEEMVLLFHKLDYLIANKKPFVEELSETLEETERLYKLEERYTAQVNLFKELGILRDGVMIGIDNKEYPVPTLEQIALKLRSPECREFFETKYCQGFSKILLVPFGMSLDMMRSFCRLFLRQYKKNHPSFSLDIPDNIVSSSLSYSGADGEDPEVDIVYNPKSFDRDHRGKSKRQLLKEQTQDPDIIPGWRILLLQSSHHDDPGFLEIPRKGEGDVRGLGIIRHDIEAGKSAEEYLSMLRVDQQKSTAGYYGESGMMPEDWMMASMIHLQETGEPLDDIISGRDSMAYLLGASFYDHVPVPIAYWHPDHRMILAEALSDNREEGVGTRTVVVV